MCAKLGWTIAARGLRVCMPCRCSMRQVSSAGCDSCACAVTDSCSEVTNIVLSTSGIVHLFHAHPLKGTPYVSEGLLHGAFRPTMCCIICAALKHASTFLARLRLESDSCGCAERSQHRPLQQLPSLLNRLVQQDWQQHHHHCHHGGSVHPC